MNAVLVAGIDTFFIWFEVLPGHRPVAMGVISIALFVIGVVFCALGLKRQTDSLPAAQETSA